MFGKQRLPVMWKSFLGKKVFLINSFLPGTSSPSNVNLSKNKTQNNTYNRIPSIHDSKIEKTNHFFRDVYMVGKITQISKVSITIKNKKA